MAVAICRGPTAITGVQSLEFPQTIEPSPVDDPWFLCATAPPELAGPFSSLQRIFRLRDEQITRDVTDVIQVEIATRRYFVKRYRGHGKNLRYFFGRSRVQAEWKNLWYFERLDIPRASLIGYDQSGWGRGFGGALISTELARCSDMLLTQLERVAGTIRQLATITRTHRVRIYLDYRGWSRSGWSDHGQMVRNP